MCVLQLSILEVDMGDGYINTIYLVIQLVKTPDIMNISKAL